MRYVPKYNQRRESLVAKAKGITKIEGIIKCSNQKIFDAILAKRKEQ